MVAVGLRLGSWPSEWGQEAWPPLDF